MYDDEVDGWVIGILVALFILIISAVIVLSPPGHRLKNVMGIIEVILD